MAGEPGSGVRAIVARRAGYRCEYCLIHEDDAGFHHELDHIISRKHAGSSDLENLAYCCVVCNRFKGSDVASIDLSSRTAVRLFDPRRDRWADHFQLDGFLIEPLTSIGEATVRVLRLNTAERIAERRALTALKRYP